MHKLIASLATLLFCLSFFVTSAKAEVVTIEEKPQSGEKSRTSYQYDGQVSKTEVIYLDGTFRVTHLASGKPALSRLYAQKDTPFVFNTWRVADHFNNGTLFCRRERQTNQDLVLTAFADDGVTIAFKQYWRYEKRPQKSLRNTDFLLDKIEEFKADGTLERQIQFDKTGQNVSQIQLFDQGKVTSSKTHTPADNVRDQLEPKLLRDPVYKLEEPGIMRVIR
ncbi:MAG: hypothetical protein K2W82_11335 [Candidatus Obscuribacterales bacterium]|nr:hypothetical protein [Candidatus Obscuribacterales bacterium]